MQVDIEVQGLSELERRLLQLGATVAEKELHTALMGASLPTFRMARRGAPGSIKRAIKRKRHRSARTRRLGLRGISATGRSAAGISVFVDKRKAPHAHLVEFGTQRRFTKGQSRRDARRGITRRYPAGVHRGVMPANPFMMKAWEQQGERRALTRFQETLERRINRLTR